MLLKDNTFMTLLLYASLGVFALGMAYKIFGWARSAFGAGGSAAPGQRLAAAAKGIVAVFFSRRHFLVLEAIVLDVILGRRQFQTSILRWVMHHLILWGFMVLLVFHAMGYLFFGENVSNLNPFWLMRDICGFLVFVGIGIAIARRAFSKTSRLKTSPMDIYAIAIVFTIMASGLALESTKLMSHNDFIRMVEDFAGMDVDDEAEDIAALEAYWVQNYALVSPNLPKPLDQELVTQGKDVHEGYCMDCHAPGRQAFMGYAGAKIASPLGSMLNSMNASVLLWYVHLLACFIGLAYLPFSKMFHMFSTPASLIVNRVMNDESLPENIATKQMIELDACVHCCSCSLTCSAMMAYETSGNQYVLPAEKMSALKKIVCGCETDKDELEAVSHGIYMCTNCDRCTAACPSGIVLKDLWLSARETLIQGDAPQPLVLSPLSFYRAYNRKKLAANTYEAPAAKAKAAVAGKFDELMDKSGTVDLTQANAGSINPDFAYCFGCQTCTTVCPVVGAYDEPTAQLGLLPHQIMCSLAMGLEEMASGASMIWDCLTCYQCQEQCPQNVPVTDILFELKNAAAAKVLPVGKNTQDKKRT